MRASDLAALTYLREEFRQMDYRRRYSRLNRFTKEQYVLAKGRFPEALKDVAAAALAEPVAIHLQANSKFSTEIKVASLGVTLAPVADVDSDAIQQIVPIVASTIASRLGSPEETTDQLIAGLIGSDGKRADLIDFANFQLRIADWVGRHSLWFSALPLIGWPTRKVRQLQSVFGRDLLVTMYWHRRFSARIFKGPPDSPNYDYYQRYYGLLNRRLERLMDALLRVGARTGAVAEEDLDDAFRTEQWLWENHFGTEAGPRHVRPKWGRSGG